MKYKFLFFSFLLFTQCVPDNELKDEYKKFINLKKENGKSEIFSCSIKPIDEDNNLSHYEIYGFSYRGNYSEGNLKVANEKKGNRLNYSILLTPDTSINLNEIYIPDSEKQKFKNGKQCKFRILFDKEEAKQKFFIKNGLIEKCNNDEKIEKKTEEKINISILVEHKNKENIHKASDEIVLD